MQQTATFLLRGGLDLVTPPVALQPGRAISAVNYEADEKGYRRFIGYERFDGRGSPNRIQTLEAMLWGNDPMEWGDAAMLWDVGASQAAFDAIEAVPGEGPVRGVWIYLNDVYAFRDQPEGDAGMFRSSRSGWTRVPTEHVLYFDTGTAEFEEGDTVTGTDSAASGVVHRVQIRGGTWSAGDVFGVLVLKSVSGSFDPGEAVTSANGAAEASTFQRISLVRGGQYEFCNFNFYGAANTQRMYFVNGQQEAFEWDGETLVPLHTGANVNTMDGAGLAKTRGGFNVIARGGGRVLLRTGADRPVLVAEYSNHLFLGFRGGTLLFSSVGVPTDWRPLTGAGEIGFGSELTGLISAASTALIVFGSERIGYVVGSDSDTFELQVLTDSAGAMARTAQIATEPIFLDAGGIRALSAADVFGGWNLGTITQAIDPMLRGFHARQEKPIASIFAKSRGLYRLFFPGGKAVSVFFGDNPPAPMPLLFPVDVHCACSAEIKGEHRAFFGSSNGFVYEMDQGDGFDRVPVEAHLRLAWNSVGAPTQNKRFHRVKADIEAPASFSIGVRRDIDYWQPSISETDIFPVDAAGRPAVIAHAGAVDWTRPDQGAVCAWVEGVGRNMAVTFVSGAELEQAHTISAVTINYTPRKVAR